MPEIHTSQQHMTKKCLVLDLDETLVHSSFQVYSQQNFKYFFEVYSFIIICIFFPSSQPVAQAHYTIPVTIEGTVHNVFVIKRPGVDEFLRLMGEHYEVIDYTVLYCTVQYKCIYNNMTKPFVDLSMK